MADNRQEKEELVKGDALNLFGAVPAALLFGILNLARNVLGFVVAFLAEGLVWAGKGLGIVGAVLIETMSIARKPIAGLISLFAELLNGLVRFAIVPTLSVLAEGFHLTQKYLIAPVVAALAETLLFTRKCLAQVFAFIPACIAIFGGGTPLFKKIYNYLQPKLSGDTKLGELFPKVYNALKGSDLGNYFKATWSFFKGVTQPVGRLASLLYEDITDYKEQPFLHFFKKISKSVLESVKPLSVFKSINRSTLFGDKPYMQQTVVRDVFRNMYYRMLTEQERVEFYRTAKNDEMQPKLKEIENNADTPKDVQHYPSLTMHEFLSKPPKPVSTEESPTETPTTHQKP